MMCGAALSGDAKERGPDGVARGSVLDLCVSQLRAFCARLRLMMFCNGV